MKAFVLSLVLLVAITAVAAISLNMLQQSSRDTYSVRTNVRL
ncbi:MAG: hypothetical protein ACREC6_07710 [Hyphomicrobiaceae bacterium]